MKYKPNKFPAIDSILLWFFCSYVIIAFFNKYIYNKQLKAIKSEIIKGISSFFPDMSAFYTTYSIALGALMLAIGIASIGLVIKASKRSKLHPIFSNAFWTDIVNKLISIFKVIISMILNLIKIVIQNKANTLCIILIFILTLIIFLNRFSPINGLCSISLLVLPILTAYIVHRMLPKIINFKESAPLSSNILVRIIGILLIGITLLEIVK